MAYSVDFPDRRCQRCGARATKEIFSRDNSPCGYYCGTCARGRIKDLERDEREQDKEGDK